jgi:hypothetical protein
MSNKITSNIKITPKEELFCKNFVSREMYGNGVESYANAYNIDLTDKKKYRVAGVEAHRMLKKPKLYKRINELLDDAGFNDAHVDKRLLHWINQSAEGATSVRAIQEYNKLKQRITEKIEHTISPIVNIRVINPNETREGNKVETNN